LFGRYQRNPGIYNPDPALSGQRLTYPNFAGILTSVSWGTASYNGLQVSVERKFSHGLQFTSNYAYSKNLDDVSAASNGFGSQYSDPFNHSFDRGISGINYPHIWTSNWVYETPGLKKYNRLAQRALGSWQVSGIYRLQSGDPFGISGGNGRLADGSPGYGNISGTNIGNERADLTGQPFNMHQGSKAQWLQQYFNPAAFQPALMGTFGNSARNILQGPGTNVCDLGIFKNFPFKEHYRLQFRVEMFNAFNRTHFDLPATNPSSPGSFGHIYSTKGYGGGSGGGQEQNVFGIPNRLMQLGLKLYW